MKQHMYRPRHLDAVTQFVSARYAAHPGEIEHVTRVAGATMNPTDWTVAMLHDLVEDGFATVDEIERLVGETTLGDSAEVIVPALELANAPRRPIRRLHRANRHCGQPRGDHRQDARSLRSPLALHPRVAVEEDRAVCRCDPPAGVCRGVES